MFGLIDEESQQEEKELRPVRRSEVELSLRAGEIVFVTGISGGGKSCLMRALCRVLQKVDACSVYSSGVEERREVKVGRGIVINQIDGEVDEAMKVLSRVGLGDVKLAMQREGVLSGGEQMRLMLGKMIQAVGDASERTVVLMDEYCSVLDRLTSKVVSMQMRKWVSRMGVCLVVATCHDDLIGCLKPDVIVRVDNGQYEILRQR